MDISVEAAAEAINCFLPAPRDFQATSKVTLKMTKYPHKLEIPSVSPEIVQMSLGQNVLMKIIPTKNWQLLRNVSDFLRPLSVGSGASMVIDNFTQLENFLNATKIPNLTTEAFYLSQSCIQ